jgi:hypothetical protein
MTVTSIAGLPFLKQDEHPPCTTDSYLFFSDLVSDQTDARRLCAGCHALLPCRQYGLDNPEEAGVWGGLTERERNGLEPPRRLVGAARASKDMRDLKDGEVTIAGLAARDRVKQENVLRRLRKYGWVVTT